MRTTFSVLTALLLLGVCLSFVVAVIRAQRTRQSPDSFAQLMDQLESLGFYRYTDPASLAEARDEVLQHEWPFHGEIRRLFRADAEELAEGGVSSLLADAEGFLRTQGVDGLTVFDEIDQTHYHLLVDGARFQIYSEEELRTKAIWELAARRSVAVMNWLLERAGSPERAYLLYGGNDGQVVFLTPAMFEAILRSGLIAERDLPVAVAEPPVRLGRL